MLFPPLQCNEVMFFVIAATHDDFHVLHIKCCNNSMNMVQLFFLTEQDNMRKLQQNMVGEVEKRSQYCRRSNIVGEFDKRDVVVIDEISMMKPYIINTYKFQNVREVPERLQPVDDAEFGTDRYSDPKLYGGEFDSESEDGSEYIHHDDTSDDDESDCASVSVDSEIQIASVRPKTKRTLDVQELHKQKKRKKSRQLEEFAELVGLHSQQIDCVAQETPGDDSALEAVVDDDCKLINVGTSELSRGVDVKRPFQDQKSKVSEGNYKRRRPRYAISTDSE